MAPLLDLQHANNRTLKRSFTAVTISSPPSPERTAVSSAAETQGRKLRQSRGVRGTGLQYSVKMPSAASTRMYENHIPSFMSVYDMETVVESPELSPAPKLSGAKFEPQQETRSQQLSTNETQQTDSDLESQIHSHQHRESTSTQTSDSTDSSPTTTISTVDSSSLSDPSPSSSPESPITLIPLSSFSGSTFGLDAFQRLKMADTPNQLPLNNIRPMTSPSPRKSKNPKALALNLNSNSGAFQIQASEPSSPSFIKPPTNPPRKKPSLLSLNTGATNSVPILVEPIASPRLPTMLQRRSLKHSVSSPQIISTPGYGPAGGMTLGGGKPFGPPRFKESNIPTNTFTISEDVDLEAPASVQMATRVPGVTVGGDSFDRPHSGEDAKSPSYPEGPILMHEPSVHLYLEPKLEEAMKFDVILNVAREVKNPFKALEKEKEKENMRSKSPFHGGSSSDIAMSPVEPDTAATMMSFRTAFEVQPPNSTESSPTTPKPLVETKIPEYIHVPWDHNTDVKDELWDLCQLIESKTKEGKRVLVHCQQGASRSATLIIAYGMYMNQDLGATEAYALAQAKSRWVNPNMSLLFSLNDFKKVIESKKVEKETAAPQKPQIKHRPTVSADAIHVPSTPTRARGNSDPSVAARDDAVAKFEERKEPTTEPQASRFADFDFGFSDMSSKMEIAPPKRQEENDWEALLSPRVEEMTANPLQDFSRSFSSKEDSETPPTPGLFSPRVFEFPRSSFFPSPGQRMSLAVDEDPRSPPTKGEAPITRSIDDVL
ncbi:Tyrosine-protein phosphatase [Lachnellula hyalina]|uniref:protein-tyrosine-phosphatase n=1 Tax=Lachnellula hyalina TaxID=1316788 RepID=A0A8H8U1D0_9HELO|nr:Tyrosine-protein phosphatase [Lachnellula hyalina]TVY27802.1 Tyrosine-protein phosphatase [Lachnellula hyalina]